MAIAYDNSLGDAETDNNSTAETASWTIAGANRFLAAFGAVGSGGPAGATSLKWGGSGGTGLTQDGSDVTRSFVNLSRWGLVAPSAASQTLYGAWAGNHDEMIVAGASYTGVDQGSPLRTSPTPTQGTSANPSITATTVAGDMVVAACWTIDLTASSGTITSAGGQTNRVKFDGGTPGPYEQFAMDEKLASGVSTTISWTLSAGATTDWIVMALILKADAGGGGGGTIYARSPLISPVFNSRIFK